MSRKKSRLPYVKMSLYCCVVLRRNLMKTLEEEPVEESKKAK
ncbi:hypothetical protein [Clostridium intestinale]|nr:hypothetical protein [Clostridium intestinale]WRY51703.1 hypothetical protein P8F83_00595 [Clostridium intestinale]